MRRIFELAVRMYPSNWRKRYGREFRALLGDVEPSWEAVFDVLQGGIQMRLRNLSLMKLTIACTIAGLLAAAAGASLIKDRYRSNAVIYIVGGSTVPVATKAVAGLLERTLSSDSLKGLIEQYGLYKDAHGDRPGDALDQMRKDITVRPVSKVRPALWLSYSYADRPKAQLVTGALVGRLMDEAANETGPRTDGVTLQVLDPPTLPDYPIAPNRLLIASMGLACGGIAGAIIGLSRRYYQSI